MGSKIAEIMALNGKDVILSDISEEILNKGIASIEQSLAELVRFHMQKAEKEIRRLENDFGLKLTEDQIKRIHEHLKPTYDEARKQDAFKRIRLTTSLEEFANVDLVIEAIIEVAQVKKELFNKLDAICDRHAVFATNTSSLSITELGASTKRASKFLGVHFFNPPTTLPLVEVIPGLETSEETVNDAIDFISGLRNNRYPLQPIRVKEVPGFLVNRILGAMLHEAFACYEEGVASMRDIDLAMKAGAGMPMGPFELADMIGIDVLYNVQQSIKAMEGGNTTPKPIHILRKLYHAGRLGKKTGRGFYEYA